MDDNVIRRAPDIGSKKSVTYRKNSEKRTLDIFTANFPVTTLFLVDGPTYFPRINTDAWVGVVNVHVIGDYGVYEYVDPYRGSPKERVRINDHSNTWIGIDYATEFASLGGIFDVSADVWTR